MARFLLGFITPTAQLTDYTAEYSLNLAGTGYVNIGLPNLSLSSNGTAGFGQQSTLDCVLNDVGLGSTKSVSSLGALKYRVGTNIISSITVHLTADRGLPLNFHGLSWFLSLSISFAYQNEVKIPSNLFEFPQYRPPPPPLPPATNESSNKP